MLSSNPNHPVNYRDIRDRQVKNQLAIQCSGLRLEQFFCLSCGRTLLHVRSAQFPDSIRLPVAEESVAGRINSIF